MAVTFENILSEIGGLGRFQIFLCVTAFVAVLPSSTTIYMPMFIMTVPDHRCALPGVVNDTYEVQSSYHQSLINLTIPVNGDGEMSSCALYNRTDNHGNATEIKCDRWVYDKSLFDRSIIEEVSLVCDQKQYRTYANMLMLMAKLFSAPIHGLISDHFGRRISFILSVIGLVIGCMCSMFIYNIPSLLVLRFVSGFGTFQMFVAGYVLVIENLEPRYRHRFSVLLNIMWVLGGFILTGIAYFVRDFQHLIITVSAPTCLLLVSICFIPESPRWLIAKGRYNEARKVLKTIARINRSNFPEETFTQLVASSQMKKQASETPEVSDMEMDLVQNPDTTQENSTHYVIKRKKESILSFLSHKVLLIRFLILLLNWTVNALVYYALLFNVSNMDGSVYMNFSLTGIADLVGLISSYLVVDIIGRRLSYAGFLLIASSSCIATLLPFFLATPAVSRIVIVALAMVGRLGVTSSFCIVYLYTTEVVPTTQRNSYLGIFATFSRLGAMTGPFVADLGMLLGGQMETVLPLLVCGVSGFIAFSLALFLPETKGRALPNSVEEAVTFNRKEKVNGPQLSLLAAAPIKDGQVQDAPGDTSRT